ncbi:hypothetical protein [Streptomyces sp. NRRL S-340]|uniref:hypothetical protein n=1 Tax=Streptomyces sp. NRRL S-340 TaxID=1463901 RepID=UPI000690DA04|nr:hypothetical protein [Streptomyces sp. NRRL S-340]
MGFFRSARRPVALCALLLALTTACTFGRAQPGQEAPPAATATAGTDVQSLHLPIERYMLTPAQTARYDWVAASLVRDCMREFGLTYPVSHAPATGAQVLQYSVMFRRYGVTDPVTARTWGYHVPRDTPPSTAAAGRAQVKPPALSVQARTVLSGADVTTGKPITEYLGRRIPVNGCYAAPDRALGVRSSASDGLQGPGTGAGGIVSRIKAESFVASLRDPRVTDVFRRWQRCMERNSYRVPADPLSASARLSALDLPEPDHAELAQARTDVACKRQTNLVGVWFAVESAHQEAAITRARDDLTRVARDRDRQLAAVQRYLSGKAPVSR